MRTPTLKLILIFAFAICVLVPQHAEARRVKTQFTRVFDPSDIVTISIDCSDPGQVDQLYELNYIDQSNVIEIRLSGSCPASVLAPVLRWKAPVHYLGPATIRGNYISDDPEEPDVVEHIVQFTDIHFNGQYSDYSWLARDTLILDGVLAFERCRFSGWGGDRILSVRPAYPFNPANLTLNSLVRLTEVVMVDVPVRGIYLDLAHEVRIDHISITGAGFPLISIYQDAATSDGLLTMTNSNFTTTGPSRWMPIVALNLAPIQTNSVAEISRNRFDSENGHGVNIALSAAAEDQKEPMRT